MTLLLLGHSICHQDYFCGRRDCLLFARFPATLRIMSVLSVEEVWSTRVILSSVLLESTPFPDVLLTTW